MDNICKICNESFLNDSIFHRHFKKHHIKIQDYYLKYFPRRDKLTNDFIDFKSKDHYFNHDFNNKENLNLWFSKAELYEKRDYIKTYFTSRINSGKMVYVPYQVELRSLLCPAVSTINKFFSYKTLCDELGLKSRDFEITKTNHVGSISVIQDTREQQPFDIQDLSLKIKCLNYGDYKLNVDIYSPNCSIERKSANDFISTLSAGYERFNREIERAKGDNCFIVVLIEESLNKILNFKENNLGFRKTKITPEFLFKNVRDILQKHSNIQFLFVANKEKATELCTKILLEGLHNKDLQLLYDNKEL